MLQTVTHAMITADGTAVPLQVNPETGEYMTASGERVVTTEIDGQQVNRPLLMRNFD